jgi:hypothetical protein
LVIGGVPITPITPSISPNGRGTIGSISLVIGNLPITVLA